MNHQKLTQPTVGVILVVLFSIGCSTLAAVPPPTLTPAPTFTLVLSPTLTPAPTPTLVPSPVALASFAMNEPIEGKEWSIIVLSAKNEGIEIVLKVAGIKQTAKADDPNTHLVQVKVRLKHLTGEAINGGYLRTDIVVKDNSGNVYPCYLAGNPLYAECTAKNEGWDVTEAEVNYVFKVPDGVKVVNFIWSDLPPVQLEVQQE